MDRSILELHFNVNRPNDIIACTFLSLHDRFEDIKEVTPICITLDSDVNISWFLLQKYTYLAEKIQRFQRSSEYKCYSTLV